MSADNRYKIQGPQGETEPGSQKRVLKNLLGIKRKKEMDRVEFDAQQKALEHLIKQYSPDHRFTSADICHIHQLWLGKIYPWAGQYRQVNMSKADFSFAGAHVVPQLMKEFERIHLTQCTPCRCSPESLPEVLAVVHVELLLIHPFRDGNGRPRPYVGNSYGLAGEHAFSRFWKD